MKARLSFWTAIAAAMVSVASVSSAGILTAEVEGGAVWFSRNDIRIPGDSGTRFDMLDLTGTGPSMYGRLYVQYAFNECHAVRLNIAPLQVKGSGISDRDILFEGSTFASGSPISATYKFNNYRLTYRWMCHRGERWMLGVGGAFLVRDAKIALRQGAVSKTNDDLGVVPLVHLYGKYLINDRSSLEFDMEGAAAPQGRAIDASLKYRYAWSSGLSAAAGYRTLEGGADNESVYTFAWLHYAVLSIGYEF